MKEDSVTLRTAAQLIDRLKAEAERAMGTLRTTLVDRGERFVVFNAGSRRGKPHFGLFPRDLFTTGLMLRDQDLLQESVRFAAHTIGTKVDPTTGEEPGRVLHEWNRVERGGLLSHYNAAEASQLLLIAARDLMGLDDANHALVESIAPALTDAGRYVLSHIDGGLFLEDPSRCGATRYFASATYWKDSHLPGREAIDYPVAYSLVQAQTVSALRSLAVLTSYLALGWRREELLEEAGRLVRAIWERMWDPSRGVPLIARDRSASVLGVSSDALHMLAYLEPDDVPTSCLEGIRAAAAQLETEYGFRSYAPGQRDYAPDAYHLGSIWPYEQAIIARGAIRFGLDGIFRVTTRVLRALEALGFRELLVWDGQRLSGGGCDVQLWTCAVPGAFVDLLQEVRRGRQPSA